MLSWAKKAPKKWVLLIGERVMDFEGMAALLIVLKSDKDRM